MLLNPAEVSFPSAVLCCGTQLMSAPCDCATVAKGTVALELPSFLHPVQCSSPSRQDDAFCSAACLLKSKRGLVDEMLPSLIHSLNCNGPDSL